MFTHQQRLVILKAGFILLIVSVLLPLLAHADFVSHYRNGIFSSTTHEQPVEFRRDGYGGFIGYTEKGRVFRQYPILEHKLLPLHRFEIDDAFFYVSDRGIITARSDLHAISIYHSHSGDA